jgi:hypothetical protein
VTAHRQTIDLNGTTYTARPYTNALRVELAEKLETRSRLRSKYNRASASAAVVQERVTRGTADGADVEQLVDHVEQMEAAERALQDSALEIAPIVFRGGEPARAPTKKTLDEHADLEELATAVGVALREEAPEPSPTTAAPAAS